MGCGHSKLPRRGSSSATVALCRGRSALLAEAIARRYALANAHRAYAGSLSATGAALHDFLRAVQDATPPPAGPGAGAGDASRNGEDADAVPPAATVPPPVPASPDASEEEEDYVDDGGDMLSPSPEDEDEDEASGDGGGIAKSPSDDEAAEAETPLPRPVSPAPRPPQPAPQPLQMVPPYVSAYPPPYDPGYPPQFGSGHPPPPYSYGPVPGPAYGYGGGYGADMGGYGQSFYNYNISYAQSQPPPPYVAIEQHSQATDATVQYYHYQGEATPSSHSHYGGYNSYPYPYPQGGGLTPAAAASSWQLAAPVPTPSPPRVSAWDFLDPFQAAESYNQDHPAAAPAIHDPSLSSDDIGEDEDIPEMEDEESGVVVREAHAGEECTCKSDGNSSCEEEEAEGHIEFRSSDAISSIVDGVESVVEEQLNDPGVAEPPAVPEKTYSSDVEVVQEIKLQFDSASKSAADVGKMLEVDKMPYNQKNPGLKVPSMMICGQPSKGKAIMQFEEEKAMECGNLSSSLQKLYIWEKKLLKEVKAAEKIRVLYEQKHKEQKKLYYGGAEAHKLEAIEICVKNLSTKLNIAIHIVNATSKKINKLRDEELWFQTHELIRRFMQMWHTMSECHQMQWRALSHAKNMDSIMVAEGFSEDHIDLFKHLELQLLDMTANLAQWLNAQKSYAAYLNEWLKKGIEYEPEVTDDGVPPFSPGRLGAPQIFTIYNNWAVSMERISEAEVVGAVHTLASNVMSIWEHHMSMDMDDQVMRKAVEAQKKKLALLRGISSSAQAAEAGLQLCLSKVFEAMESFAAACENAYKDLHLRAEEERARVEDQENGRAPVADIAGVEGN
ncbi:uncharacterized protein C2845_PM14G21370 [Panicum miliaceum]|uniref:DUF632 domain-containing protein n=1 Tax=Panicum miliaceum TaxID=4540 RepID=A0A3L6PML7_PANMI|nr:uncharacterized protein C2845_PM14G21370 [Panicum miliaceum]